MKCVILIVLFLAVACSQNGKGQTINTDKKSSTRSDYTNVKTSAILDSEEINKLVYEYQRDSLNIKLSLFRKSNPNAIDFNMEYWLYGQKILSIKEKVELILVENEDGSFSVPEGTSILDNDTGLEYNCDSTFTYYSDKVNISMGFEIGTKERISFILYNSSIVEDGIYTLYRIQ